MNNPLLNKLNKDLKFVYSDNDTLSIIFNDNEILMGVVGEFNNNLKELEKITETKIYSRGNSILVKSSSTKNELVKNAIIFLTDQLILNGTIEKKDIISSINKFMINEKTVKKIEVLVENKMKKNQMYFGRNEYLNGVIFDGDEKFVGKTLKIKIDKVNQNNLFGKIDSNSDMKAA